MKRFTDSNKWLDPWFRCLSSQAKMLWLYILDHCDNVGIVEIYPQLVSNDCGIKCNADTVAELGDRVQHISGNKYLIGKFISFQYGKLSPSCRPHEKILDAIDSNGLIQVGKSYVYPVSQKDKGMDTLSSKGMDTLQEQEEEKDKEKEQDKDKDTLSANKAKATREELEQFCRENGLFPRDAEYLWARWESNGWVNGKTKIKDWRMTVRSWKAQGYLPSQKQRLDTDYWPSDEPESTTEESELENPINRLFQTIKTLAEKKPEPEPVIEPMETGELF